VAAKRLTFGAALLALTACGLDTVSTEQAPCPRIVILADGADLTRFRPDAGRDLTGLVVDARLVGFTARCDFTGRDRTALEVRVTPRFEAERGPGAAGRTAELPWFAALTNPGDAELLDRPGFTARATFAPNTARAVVDGQTARLTFPVGTDRPASAHTIRLSFQLTPDELALNRARGPR